MFIFIVMSFLHEVRAMASDDDMIVAMISGRDFMMCFMKLVAKVRFYGHRGMVWYYRIAE